MADDKSAFDVVEFLERQHHQIEGMFEQVLLPAGAERSRAFTELRRLPAVNETAEEALVHPRGRRKLAYGAEVIAARLGEEKDD